jgi:hypothetical protein
MKRRESVQFFIKFLLLSLFSIINVVICLSIIDNGKFLGFIALVLIIVNSFFLFFMLIKSIRMFFKHLFNKDKKRFEFLYIFNIVFSTIITGLYLFFYFILIMGIFVILLPFLA